MTEKPVGKAIYLSCTKIATFRKGMQKTEKGYRSNNVFTLFAFEKEKSLTFVLRHRDSFTNQFSSVFVYCLKLSHKKKTGEPRFTFYKIRVGANGISTCAPCLMLNKLLATTNGITTSKDGSRNTLQRYAKAHEKRLRSVLIRFLGRHKVKCRHLGKCPFVIMTRLCYPGTAAIDESLLPRLSLDSSFMDDPVKLALRTKGKKSRRLLFESIKLNPGGARTICRLARYLRINRSLDEAQTFLSAVIKKKENHSMVASYVDESYSHHVGRRYSLLSANFSALKILDPLEPDNIADLFSGYNGYILFEDTLQMIDQYSQQNEALRLELPRYRTLRQLHDYLAALPGMGRRRNKSFVFEHYEFKEDSVFVKVSSEICNSVNTVASEYEFFFPRNTQELQQQGEDMHNCAFCYASRLRDSDYMILCVRRGSEKPVYMLGFRLVIYVSSKFTKIKLEQAVTHCNARIEIEEMTRISSLLHSAFSRLDQGQSRLEYEDGDFMKRSEYIAYGEHLAMQ